MFDTHCHLNFSAFKKNLGEVIQNAKKEGVNYFVIPGTDFESSKHAIEIAEQYEGIYAAVGIHPHHIFQIRSVLSKDGPSQISQIEALISRKKVVAVGEIGLDRHMYKKTKYQDYQINEGFIELQKEFLKKQIGLAIKYKKNIILHNREAKNEILKIVGEPAVAKALAGKAVFHCCEPDQELLDFAIQHTIFIGVDGDVTYNQKKQEFVKKIPLELLVLETDSPFLLPEPFRTQRQFPNEPKNISVIANFISRIKQISAEQLNKITTENAKKLFQINS